MTRTANTTAASTSATEATSTTKTRRNAPKKDWTIVTALDFILDKCHHSELEDSLWRKCKEPLAFLREKLGLTDMQLVILAMLCDTGRPLGYKNFAVYLGCSRLKVMVYSDEVDQLVDNRWIHSARCEGGEFGFELEKGVVNAFRHNKAFVPEKIDGLTESSFYEKLNRHINNAIHKVNCDFTDEMKYIKRLFDANSELPVVSVAQCLKDDPYDVMAWLMIVDDYIVWHHSPDEGLLADTIGDNFPDDDIDVDILRESLIDGSHIMYSKGMIEMNCEEGVADNTRYFLTKDMKEMLFPDTKLLKKNNRGRRRRTQNDLKKYKDIKEKVLFYNPAEGEKMTKLASLLSQEQLPQVQARLEEQGLRKGFACLLYGGPGVGKTESVYQIARQTGRDLMQVNIAGMRDKFVGESEKNIKQVFNRYRELCKECKVMPILFFNEADAIFGKRTTFGGNNPSVEKMDNAMQNIILQEMEDLEGILIATTNLTDNLDSAFERRFLFKVEFHNPNVEIKEKIWSSMVSEISDEEAHELATRYDLSPGQIENVARKKTIDYIINGEQPTLERLSAYCQDEQIASKTKAKPVAGFRQ